MNTRNATTERKYYAQHNPYGRPTTYNGSRWPIGTVMAFATKTERDQWVNNAGYNSWNGQMESRSALTAHEARLTMLEQIGKDGFLNNSTMVTRYGDWQEFRLSASANDVLSTYEPGIY